ncbi:uncharacterized protein EDB91DRAFT_1081454 [Suillus paluster]|uniref:uncharacterized protein n=1 Tax=Suillus paluster TaxID=48578 RepID=UPI001B87C0EB|nr:uncharacterized protein EDB91DRAFT_1081454 [Suillus paluster]KAG1742269.1 hypothetical protein EDB91DRAFT_1081454 [Suillus paluster]
MFGLEYYQMSEPNEALSWNRAPHTLHDGDEEIEEDETGTWLDYMQESSTTVTTPNDVEFNVEPEIDLNADGFLAVLADLAPDSAGKNKGKGKAKENQKIEENGGGGDDKWPEEWP